MTHQKLGIKYDGDIQNEQYHGQGILKIQSNYVYNGQFKEGHEEGKGKMSDVEKGIKRYKGDFKTGKPNGEGNIQWKEGAYLWDVWQYKFFIGTFVDGYLHGEGKLKVFRNGKEEVL